MACGRNPRNFLQSFIPVMRAKPTVDVLLVGCGLQRYQLGHELRRGFREEGIGVETMDVGAACRTYNALLAESRYIVAALVMLPL